MNEKNKQQAATYEKKEKYNSSENPEINPNVARPIIENNMKVPDPKDL